MKRPWTSYEPGPDGRGYKLFDDQGGSLLVAPTPSLDALLPSLTPRADYLANAGRGGAGGAPAAPPAGGGDPSQQFAGPPPQVSDVGPAYSSQPEPVSRAAPEPPPPEASPAPAASPASRPRARLASPGTPQESPEAPGAAFDPAQIPASPLSPEETALRLAEDAYMKRGALGGPVVRTPAHWQDKQRTTQGKVIDPAAIAEWEAAQAAAQQSAGDMARAKAESEARALDLQKRAAEKENEIEARKGAASRLAQEEQLKIEARLEEQRRRLENPTRDFWEGEGTAGQVAASIALALGNAADALRGGKGDAASKVLQQAIDRHIGDRERQITLLERQRGRSKEAGAEAQARLEAERITALRQIDDQVKQTLAAGLNPIQRELVLEDVPPSEATKATAVAIVRGLRKMIPGANQDPADIQKSADEYIRTMTPQEKRMVFDLGPNGELVPKERVRLIAAEHAQNSARLDAARERLGLADKLGAVQSLAQEWEKEKTTGGGGDPLKLRMQILKDRIKRGADVRDQDLKAASITGPVAAAQRKAAAEAGEKAEARAEKEGARTFVLGGQEYVTRPGTSEKEMQATRDVVGDFKGMREAIKILNEEASAKNKFRDNPRVNMAAKTFAGLGGTAVFNSGIVNPSELDSVVKTANSLGYVGPDGIKALEDTVNIAEARYRARLEQMGAKPKGSR